ncbi:hypothetical protein ACN19N_09990 [Acinetobacter sp. LF10]
MVNSAIQVAAQTKCKHDLDNFAAWKVASKLMTKNQEPKTTEEKANL